MFKVGDPGTMMVVLKAVPTPEGWLNCDGKVYSKEASPALFSLLGSANRLPGDPPDCFRVPQEKPLIPSNAIVKLIIRA